MYLSYKTSDQAYEKGYLSERAKWLRLYFGFFHIKSTYKPKVVGHKEIWKGNPATGQKGGHIWEPVLEFEGLNKLIDETEIAPGLFAAVLDGMFHIHGLGIDIYFPKNMFLILYGKLKKEAFNA